MPRFKILTKIFCSFLLVSVLWVPLGYAQAVPSLSGLKFGIVRDSCAPWDGPATELILTPTQNQCGDSEKTPPFIRIAINNRSLENLTPGTYLINPKEQLASQASFVYGEISQTQPLHSFMQFAQSAVLTIQSLDAEKNTISGEFQFTFADQHSETVAFEVMICRGNEMPCG